MVKASGGWEGVGGDGRAWEGVGSCMFVGLWGADRPTAWTALPLSYLGRKKSTDYLFVLKSSTICAFVVEGERAGMYTEMVHCDSHSFSF